MGGQQGMEVKRFIVFTDFPTIPDPEGNLNSHGDVRRVPVCDCPRRVERFESREDAEAFASSTAHAVVLPVLG